MPRHAGGEEGLYPHLYGVLNPDAVSRVLALRANPDGNFSLPPGIDG